MEGLRRLAARRARVDGEVCVQRERVATLTALRGANIASPRQAPTYYFRGFLPVHPLRMDLPHFLFR